MQTNQSPKSDNGLSKGQNAVAEEMSIIYIISVFARELPGYFIFGWIFMPVTLLLLLLIVYFRIQLSKGESEFGQKEWVGRQNFSFNSLLSGLYY
uniref:Uncharacterized protein n=1 Tax=Meleagris gallopavo TaxID=9103 RepID=A0A803YIA6_MELGA